MSRFVIGANGLTSPKAFTVKPLHTYYLGASDSPNLILVLSVTEERITYVTIYNRKRSIVARWIGEDLIAQGCATIQRRAKGTPWEKTYTDSIGAPATPADFDRVIVRVKANRPQRPEDLYGPVKDFGVLVEFEPSKRTLAVETSRRSIPDIEADKRWKVISVTLVESCPTE